MSDTNESNKIKPPGSGSSASTSGSMLRSTSTSILRSTSVSGSSVEPESKFAHQSALESSTSESVGRTDSTRLDKISGLFESPQDALVQVEDLKYFLATAPASWQKNQVIRRYFLPTDEHISCVLWRNLYHITGTDIVRCLTFRFEAFGRRIKNRKKFEEGIFSDLRNLKTNSDAVLEGPKSPFLDFLYKNNCIRTQKKQKVFYWFSVSHDRLFVDALERDLKRETQKQEPTTEAIAEPALSFQYDDSKPLFDQLTDSIEDSIESEEEFDPSSKNFDSSIDIADMDVNAEEDDAANKTDSNFTKNDISAAQEVKIIRVEQRQLQGFHKTNESSKISTQSIPLRSPKSQLGTSTEPKANTIEVNTIGPKSKPNFLKLVNPSSTVTSSVLSPAVSSISTSTGLTGQVINQQVEPSYDHMTDQPIINTSTITLYSQSDLFNPASAKYGEFQNLNTEFPIIKSEINSDFPLDYFPPSAFDALFSNYDMLDSNSTASSFSVGNSSAANQAENGEYELTHSAISGPHSMSMGANSSGVFNNSEQGFSIAPSIMTSARVASGVTTPYKSMFTSNAPYNYYGTELQQAPMIGSSLPADFTLPPTPVGYSLMVQAQLQQQQQQQLQQLQQYQLQQQLQFQQQFQAIQMSEDSNVSGLGGSSKNINASMPLNPSGYNMPLYYNSNNSPSASVTNEASVGSSNGSNFLMPSNFNFGHATTPTSLFHQNYPHSLMPSVTLPPSVTISQQQLLQPHVSQYFPGYPSAANNQASVGIRNFGSAATSTPSSSFQRPNSNEKDYKPVKTSTNTVIDDPTEDPTKGSGEIKKRQAAPPNHINASRKKSRGDGASFTLDSTTTTSVTADHEINPKEKILSGPLTLSESGTNELSKFPVDCPLFEDYNVRNSEAKNANYNGDSDNNDSDYNNENDSNIDSENNSSNDEVDLNQGSLSARNSDARNNGVKENFQEANKTELINKDNIENSNSQVVVNDNNDASGGDLRSITATEQQGSSAKQVSFFDISALDNEDKNGKYDVVNNDQSNTLRGQSEIIIEEVLGLR